MNEGFDVEEIKVSMVSGEGAVKRANLSSQPTGIYDRDDGNTGWSVGCKSTAGGTINIRKEDFMKKILCLCILCLIFVTTLFGCATTGEEKDTSAPTSTESQGGGHHGHH